MLSYYYSEQRRMKTHCNSLGSTSIQPRRFDELFQRYRKVFVNGALDEQRFIVNEMVSNLLSTESSILAVEQRSWENETASMTLEEIFTCDSCEEFLHSPVTLACGHTFCSDCLHNYQNEETTFCLDCGKDSSFNYTTNIALRELFVTWFPEETYIRERVTEAKKILHEGNLSEFMELVNRLLTKYPKNVNLLYLRAHGYSCERNLFCALRDLDLACSLAPFNSKIFYARGEVLADSNENEEAMSMFLRAAALKPKDLTYRSALTVYLEKLLKDGMCTASRFQTSQNFYIEQENTKSTLSLRSLAVKSKTNFNESCTSERNSPNAGQACAGDAVRNLSESKDQYLDDTYGSYCKMRDSDTTEHTRCQQVCCTKGNLSPPQSAKSTNIPSELECKMCFNLMYDPITTPCGHSLCRCCLRRCLDHRFECPCCRTNLQNYLEHLIEGKIGTSRVLENIILLKFSEEYEARKISYEKELNEFSSCGSRNGEIPIFVCTMAVPGIACPLHIFEPRYKLMIRRCLESGSRQFGMCVEDAVAGTLLYINDAKFLPDGRSIVHTVGTRRFKVLERGMKDGYNTAKVEWLQDETDGTDHTELHFQVYGMMANWIENLPSEQQTCIVKAVGQMPSVYQRTTDHGPNWIWWLLAVMPLNTEAKQIILSMTSVTERLSSIKRFLTILLNKL